MKLRTVAFVTTLVSPFQIELANEINRIGKIHYKIVFTQNKKKGRGSHWNSYVENKNVIIEPNSNFKIIYKTLKKLNPDLIIVGQNRGFLPNACKIYSLLYNKPFIFWFEQPFPVKNFVLKLIKRTLHSFYFIGAKNIMCIGERSVTYYSKFKPCVLIPYAQDLAFINKNYFCKKENDLIHFLFSGQLIERHNIQIIINAILKLYDSIGPNFKFVFAADGPLKYLIDNELNTKPKLKQIIQFNNKYENWNDRLLPFKQADVLIYPSKHSGWGLVVPEALACGVPVITTKNVESARYFIDENYNGVFISESTNELFEIMKKCVKEKEWLKQLQNNTQTHYLKGDITIVAPNLISHILFSINESNY